MHELIQQQLSSARREDGSLDIDTFVRDVSAVYGSHGISSRENTDFATTLLELEALNRERATELEERGRELSTVREVLEATLENVEQGIMMIDGEHRVRVCNRRAAELLELPLDFMNRQPLFSEVLEYQWSINEFDITPAHIIDWIRSGGVAESPPVYQRRRRNGKILEISTILLPHGGAVRTYSDITDRRAQEDALHDAVRDYRSLFENAVVGIYRATIKGRIVRTNPALARLNGYESASALLSAVGHVSRPWYVEPNRRAEFRYLLERDVWVTDFVSEVYAHATRKRIWVSETAWLVRDGKGAPAFYEGTVMDATDRIEAEARIAHLAHYDELTGLPNRAHFKIRASEEAALAVSQTPCAILCLDLDRFKSVNDTLGHGVGDQLLCAAAERLRRALGKNNFVARLGGDEFAVILRDFESIADVEARAQALVDQLARPFRIGVNSPVVGASIGIALAPRDGTTPDELLQNADLALYKAKGDGRGAYRLYDKTMKDEALFRRSIETDLRSALEREELALHYQPVIRVGDGATVGFEALIRWTHKSRGLVSPSIFIPVAEDAGLSVEIGDWVLRQACADLARLPEDMRINVNLSPAQLRVEGFVEETVAILAGCGIAPNRLVLEITETILMMDEPCTLHALEQLRAHGICIALDDFGTGYSSLSYLQKFRFDEIKIDRAFVSRLGADPVAGAIVGAVMALAHELGMRVVGEGVETPAQMAALTAFGCDLAQGFLLGHPLPAQESFPAAIDKRTSEHLQHLRNVLGRSDDARGQEQRMPRSA
jgi:diguanylate cyclase (GGDEF)-like protein/PAS domain S-box-containing protein